MASGKRIGKLDTIESVSIEYRRVYRKARNNEMELADAKAFCWMLKQLSGMLFESDLEKRLAELEARL